jgi:hypothetical protein
MMIGPAVFLLAKGSQRIRAKTLAYQIISRLRDAADDFSTGDDTVRNAETPDMMTGTDHHDNDKKGTDTPLPPSRPNRDNVIDRLDSGDHGISQGNEDDEVSDEAFSVEVQRTRGGGPATTHDEMLEATTEDFGESGRKCTNGRHRAYRALTGLVVGLREEDGTSVTNLRPNLR